MPVHILLAFAMLGLALFGAATILHLSAIAENKARLQKTSRAWMVVSILGTTIICLYILAPYYLRVLQP